MGCDAARCVTWIFNKFEYLDKEQLKILSKKSYYDLSDTMQLHAIKEMLGEVSCYTSYD